MGSCFGRIFHDNSDDQLGDYNIETIGKDTNLTRYQILTAYGKFKRIETNGRGFVLRSDFMKNSALAANPMCHNILNGFFDRSTVGGGHGCLFGIMDFRQYCRVLAHFMPTDMNEPWAYNGHLSKSRLLFRIYDGDNDGHLNKEELGAMIATMLGSPMDHYKIMFETDLVFETMDTDGDGCISFEEFNMISRDLDIASALRACLMAV